MLTTVTSGDGLLAALRAAQGGDTIQLAQGAYNNLSIQNLKFDQTVTITSANPSAETVINGLTLRNVQGLTFQNLEFTVAATEKMIGEGVKVYNATNVHFDHVDVHGSLDADSSNDNGGMLLRDSTDVSVTNSEFHELYYGLAHRDSSDVLVSGNRFHDIRMDGMQGGGSSNVTVTKNAFYDFYGLGAIGSTGDHSDAIQFWTTLTTSVAHDITISDNLIVRGAGRIMQGVFVQDESGVLPYDNLVITNNTIIGATWNGLQVNGGKHVEISGNTVVGLADQQSWIGLDKVSDAVLSNNIASSYAFKAGVTYRETNDSTVAQVADGGRALLLAWQQGLAAARGGVTIPVPSDLGGLADAAVRSIEAARLDAVVITGTSGADRLTVNLARNTRIDAGDGADILTGGGLGQNTLAGGLGDDTYNIISKGDRILELPGEGRDTAVATVDYVLDDNVENLRLGGAATMGVGNGLDNQITGASAAETLSGLDGADTILGQAGADLILGDAGADSLAGGDGDDRVFGGDDGDTIVETAGSNYLRGDEGNDSIRGGSGVDDINGNMGADTVAGGAGNDWVVGGKDNDRLLGEDGDDIVYGNLGDDTCDGGAGADLLKGGQGNDSIAGGAGDDYISGDRGDDTLSGGAGADLFHSFGEGGVDRILDFSVAQGDRLVLDVGTTYTVSQVGADTVIAMTGGATTVLVGFNLASLGSGSIFLG